MMGGFMGIYGKTVVFLLLIVGCSAGAMGTLTPQQVALFISRGQAGVRPVNAFIINETRNVIFARHDDNSVTAWDFEGHLLRTLEGTGANTLQAHRTMELLSRVIIRPDQVTSDEQFAQAWEQHFEIPGRNDN